MSIGPVCRQYTRSIIREGSTLEWSRDREGAVDHDSACIFTSCKQRRRYLLAATCYLLFA